MIDDRALVSRILSGDRQAFRMLIKQHERLVAHMVGRLVKNNEEREELCQDVFLKVYDKLGEFSFGSRLSTWIATIAYRHAINHLRKKKVWTKELREDEIVPASMIEQQDPESMLAESDLHKLVVSLIDRLPAQYRIVVTLYHVEGMNYPEIVDVTGMPEGTVKSYLFRARSLLKDSVKIYLGQEEWR